MKYEIESKFEVKNAKKLNVFLEDADFIKEGKQSDIYYDTKKSDYFYKAIFLRVRDEKRLDFKFNLDFTKGDKHDGCLESCFEIPFASDILESLNKTIELLNMKKIDVADFEDFLSVNEFVEFVPIKKKFKLYKRDGFNIRVDDVDSLGEFVEIEKVLDSETEVEKTKQEIKKIADEIDLHFVNTGYVELYLRKYKFDVYINGPFVLEEDLQKAKNK